jgi:hypothetical protein
MIPPRLGKKQGPISKITRAKRAGGMAQAVKHLPSKFKPQYLKKQSFHINTSCNQWRRQSQFSKTEDPSDT